MTEPEDPAAPPADRRTSKRGRATLAELVLIVRPPGNPQGTRAFTAAQAEQAAAYAADVGATLDDLP